MFTGIVFHTQPCIFDNHVITFKPDAFWNDAAIGDSIAVNGVCLTVVTNTPTGVTFFVSGETLSLTNLGACKVANLEKSFKLGDRNSGHYVSGHVHTTCVVREVVHRVGGERDIWFDCDVTKLVYKDSICVNGVSLTIAKIDPVGFMVSMIPHTWDVTTFSSCLEGDIVNIEYNTYPIYATDEDHMRNALAVSESANWWDTVPNPQVGCVITKNNVVVATGYHRKCGSKHAETEALSVLSDDLRDCTMYVTLEPCCHHGKQPPCVDTIIKSQQISRVVVGVVDSDNRVNSRGISKLKEAGIQVDVGTCAREVKESLKAYLRYKDSMYPYVVAKIALTQDSIYAVHDKNVSMTSAHARLHGHGLRAQSQCIIVGSNTVRVDDPRLTARGGAEDAPQPLVVVFDSKGVLTGEYKCLKNPHLIMTSAQSDKTYWDTHGIEYKVVDSVCDAMEHLHSIGMQRCLLEGGVELQRVFMDNNLIDEFHVYRSKKSLGIGKRFSLNLIAFDTIGSEAVDQTTTLTRFKKADDTRRPEVGFKAISLLARVTLRRKTSRSFRTTPLVLCAPSCHRRRPTAWSCPLWS